MSGTCMEKRGKKYRCRSCESFGLKPNFDYCPFCGDQIVMRWDMDNDVEIGDEVTV